MRRGDSPSVPRRAVASRPERLVVRLGVGAPLGVGSVGGKGASLDRLARLGLEVPPAVAVTALAFQCQLDAVLRRVPQAADWLSLLPDEAARESLVAAFQATPTDPGMLAAVREAVGELMRDLAAAPSIHHGHERLAVRSSAIDEDGAAASFAGLHATELGCASDQVDLAVRRCWASLWSRPAMAYRARHGLGCAEARMSVVIQALVPADVSAVVFTRHPVTGREDQILVTAIRGLGEPMVSGSATPDTITIERASRAVVRWDPGLPGPRLLLGSDGLVEVPDTGVGPVLDDAALDALVDLALAVDAAHGEPVDIEAAHAAGRWLLLQARPITTR